MRINIEDLGMKNFAAKSIHQINKDHEDSDLIAYLFQVDLNGQPRDNGDLPIIGSTISEFGNWIETTGSGEFEKMYGSSDEVAILIHLMQAKNDSAKQESNYLETTDDLVDMIDRMSDVISKFCDSSFYGVIAYDSGIDSNDIFVLHKDHDSDLFPAINSYFISQEDTSKEDSLMHIQG